MSFIFSPSFFGLSLLLENNRKILHSAGVVAGRSQVGLGLIDSTVCNFTGFVPLLREKKSEKQERKGIRVHSDEELSV